MRDLHLILFIFIFICFLSGIRCQVPGFGNLNSIGKSPYPPSSFFPEQIWGVHGGNNNRWPNGIVPYIFDHNSSDPADNLTITPALAVEQIDRLQFFMNNTCIKFVPRTNETDYIAFRFSNHTCSSKIGRAGGRQNVNLRPFCYPTIHEIMHAIGFGHEERRRDRDYYTAFNWTNIKPGYYERNNLPTYGTPMDPASTMMTSQYTGQINSSYPTYILADGSNPLVNSDYKYYSEGDRQKINRAYNCIPEDSCWDEDPFNCPVWAAAGACKDPNWVPKTACPKKCCYDTSSRCLNDKLHCNTSSWAGMCNKTCNICPKDNREDCQYIAATLGCNRDPVKWPGGMTKYCRKSCKFCTRPAVVNIPPMILTKCKKTCHKVCKKITGCNPLALPQKNIYSDYYCSGPNWPIPKLIDWCKTNKRKDYCETTCFKLGVKMPCPPECVDSDPVNCPHLAATKGCFSRYDL